MASNGDLEILFPQWDVPFTDANGRLTRHGIELILRLIRRTGGDGGGEGQLTSADVLGLEALISLPIDLNSQAAGLAIALGQVWAAIAALQQSIPAFGEVVSAPSASAGLSEMTMASGMSQSSMSEMTFARV